jgi:phage-related protein
MVTRAGRGSAVIAEPSKQIVFLGSSLKDLTAFPLPARRVTGHALRLAQQGARHADARPMHGFGSAQVLEIPVDHATDTYRTMYTVSLGDVVYVLHAFQKKSTQGSKTPRRHLETIARRLAQAQELQATRHQHRGEQDNER